MPHVSPPSARRRALLAALLLALAVLSFITARRAASSASPAPPHPATVLKARASAPAADHTAVAGTSLPVSLASTSTAIASEPPPLASPAGHEACCDAFSAPVASVIGFALATGNFARAAAALATLPTGPERDRAQRHLAELWAARNPAAAANYADDLPPGANRWAALAGVALQWRERDVAAAGAWLTSAPRTRDHDAAVAAIANYIPLMQDDPALAVTWAERVVAPTLRRDTLRSALRHWSLRDEAAARRHVETSPLFTPAERTQLLAGLAAGSALLD